MHREIFKDAFLDLFKPVVVVVKHRLGVRDRIVDFALLSPRQANHGVDVIAHDRGFGRHRRHQLQFLELGINLLASFLGKVRCVDLLFKLFDIGALFAFAKFLLNCLDLLVQVVIALALLHLLLDAAANTLLDLQDVDLGFQLCKQRFKALSSRKDLKHFLLLLQLERQVRGDRVGQSAGIVDARERGQDFRRNLLVKFDVLLKLADDRTPKGFNLGPGTLIGKDGQDFRREMRVRILDGDNAGALRAFDQHLDRAVRQLEHLQDRGDAAYFVDVVRGRIILAGRLLCRKHDAFASFHRGLKGANRAGTTHKQRDHHMGEHDDVAQRQHRQVDGFCRESLTTRHGEHPKKNSANRHRARQPPRCP